MKKFGLVGDSSKVAKWWLADCKGKARLVGCEVEARI